MAIDTAPPRSTWRRRRPEPEPEQSTEPLETATAHPVPMSSLVAAARRITGETLSRVGQVKEQGWQADAIDLYSLVGEQRFLVTTLAGRVGAARFYAGKLDPDDPTAKPEMVDAKEKPAQILEALGETPAARAQLIARQSVNLSTTGDGWLVGIPEDLLETVAKSEQDKIDLTKKAATNNGIEPDGKSIDIESLKWFMLSVKEVSSKKNSKTLILKVNNRKIEVDPDQVWPVRVWNPDPFDFESADSPTKSSLPVLRELVGLTAHISAQIDSRLAGAGIFIVPQSAKDAILAELGDDYEGEDPFVEILMEAMLTAIADRSNASALVPIVLTVPDAVAGSDFWHLISFSSALDKEARSLREEAIRRLALGQDIPPEVLLGVGSMNHWGAWLVREDTITTHVEPQLALICDALTTQYLWPVLEQQGMSEAEYQQYVIWYDVDHLISRPTRLADAVLLHQEGVISDKALRDAGQFTDGDAQVDVATSSPAASLVLKMIQANASLIRNPGVDALLQAVDALLTGQQATPAQPPGTDLAVPPAPTPQPVQGKVVAEGGPPQQPGGAPLAAGAYDSGPPLNINVNVEPAEAHYTIQMPEGFTASAPAPVINNILPEQQPPTIIVDTQPVSVKVNPTPVEIHNEVKTPDVNVTNEVKTPTVNVEPTPVTVTNEVKTPTVNVKPADVKIIREKATPKRRIRITRDKNDKITGAEEQ